MLGFLEVRSLRRLPATFVNSIVSDSESASAYFALAKARVDDADETSIEVALDDLISVLSFESARSTDMAARLFSHLLQLLLKATLPKAKAAMVSRFPSFLSEWLKVSSLDEMACALDAGFDGAAGAAEIDDSVISEALRAGQKALKRVAKMKKRDEQTACFAEVARICLIISKAWLFLDPILTAELIDELQETVKELSAAKRDTTGPAPGDVLVEVLLKLLSAPSHFLKSVVEELVKRMASFFTPASVDLLTAVLNTNSRSSMQEDMMEDMEEDYDDMEEDHNDMDLTSDSADSMDEFDVLKTLGYKRTLESEEDSPSEPEVLLDDADEEELAMYDSKLAEIFRQKKIAKTSAKMSAQATLHFKTRVLHCTRALLDHQSSLPAPTRLHLLSGLTESLALNLREASGAQSIASSIAEMLKTAVKRGQPLACDVEAEYLRLFQLTHSMYWDNFLLWSTTQALCLYYLKSIEQARRLELAAASILDAWTALCANKKIQKTRFFDIFTTWADCYRTGCWDLVERKTFVAELLGMNAHCRTGVLAFLRALVSRSSEAEIPPELVSAIADLVHQLASEVPMSAKVLKEAIRILPLVFKRSSGARAQLTPELRSRLTGAAGMLEKNLGPLLLSALK